MGVPPTLVVVRVLMAHGQVRRGSIAKAARSMSVEQVEAAHLELEVCLPAARGCAPSCSDLCMPVNAGAKAWTSASTESGHQAERPAV